LHAREYVSTALSPDVSIASFPACSCSLSVLVAKRLHYLLSSRLSLCSQLASPPPPVRCKPNNKISAGGGRGLVHHHLHRLRPCGFLHSSVLPVRSSSLGFDSGCSLLVPIAITRCRRASLYHLHVLSLLPAPLSCSPHSSTFSKESNTRFAGHVSACRLPLRRRLGAPGCGAGSLGSQLHLPVGRALASCRHLRKQSRNSSPTHSTPRSAHTRWATRWAASSRTPPSSTPATPRGCPAPPSRCVLLLFLRDTTDKCHQSALLAASSQQCAFIEDSFEDSAFALCSASLLTAQTHLTTLPGQASSSLSSTCRAGCPSLPPSWTTAPSRARWARRCVPLVCRFFAPP